MRASTAKSHVTLVRPPTVSQLLKLDTDVSGSGAPPLGLAYVAAALERAGHAVTVVDAVGEAPSQMTPLDGMPLCLWGLTAAQIVARIPADTDCIGVSCMFTSEWLYCREVVDAISAAFPQVPLIMGGEHATADFDYVMRSCPGITACVLGEGEETVVELVEALGADQDLAAVPGIACRANGGVLRTEARRRTRRLDELPWPKWDAVPIERYLASGLGYGVSRGRVMPMLASRGCPYRCTFCSNPGMWGKLWNVRSPEDVVAEIKHYQAAYGATHITFYDLTMIIRRDWIKAFAETLIREQVRIEWSMPSGTRCEALDAEVALLLKRSGCNKISFAPESGSKRELELIQKQVDLEKVLEAIRISSRAGLITKAHIIMGFPHSTIRDTLHTYWFLVRMAWAGLNDCPIYLFHPYPGSKIHDDLRDAGRLPGEGDAYDRFMALSLYNNYYNITSWNPNMGAGTLRALAIGGMALLYGSQFLFRPWRLLASCLRVLRSEPVTMLERAPEILLKRLGTLGGRRGGTPSTAPVPIERATAPQE